jgi:hypothetical protein
MPKYLTCNKCGSSEDATEDYEGEILCGLHGAEKELRHLRVEYKELQKWVQDCWLSKLEKMSKKISSLEIRIEQYVSDKPVTK